MSWTKTRSEIANTVRRDPDADTTELRRQLKAERLAEHVAAIVDSAPKLTDEQLAKVASLLVASRVPAAQSRRKSGGDAA